MKRLGLILIILLVGCATAPKQPSSKSVSAIVVAKVPPTALNESARYQKNRSRVKNLSAWKITGALAAKHQGEGWQARLIWREASDKSFSGRLYAYFSPEQVVVKGKPGFVELYNEKGDHFQDASIESMIKKSSGWQIPMDDMRYWIRGMDVPGKTFKATYNNRGRLDTLLQSGWKIVYKEMTDMSGYTLPKKLELYHGRLRLRLVIAKWSL